MNRKLAAFCILLLCTSSTFGQSAKDQVGYTKLEDEVGGSLEDGSGLKVGFVEAPSGSAYLPNLASAEFTGKTITDGSGTNVGSSSHAAGVANNLFGNTVSMSGGVTDITGYNANHWINVVLGVDTSNADGLQRAVPAMQDFAVMNHSYISTTASEEYLRRMDFVAERDNVTMVVATNNGEVPSGLPDMFASTYNTITVGVTSGKHWHGDTSSYVAGRIKPEIVAPQGATSWATPMVASAATILRQQAGTLTSANATRNEVTKAVLLAGATKSEFAGWSQTSTRPLDSQYGAGELNIYNSYQIQGSGEFDGGADAGSTLSVAEYGWDYENLLSASESRFYNIDVTQEVNASIVLTWNASISESGMGELDYDTFELADLDLQFYDSSGSFLGTLLRESVSKLDNVEHLFIPELGIGNYTIAVRGISGATDYALAWRFTAVPEPSGVIFLATSLAGCLLRRRSRST